MYISVSIVHIQLNRNKYTGWYMSITGEIRGAAGSNDTKYTLIKASFHTNNALVVLVLYSVKSLPTWCYF